MEQVHLSSIRSERKRSESLKVNTYFTFGKKKKKDSCMNFCPLKFYICDTWVIADDLENRNTQGADLTCLEEVAIM